MKNKLTLGSLFDGSGGFCLGGLLAEITPIWGSEIEPFPIRVTTKQMPFVEHFGDVSKLSGEELQPVDIITFGSPCFPAGTLVLTDKGFVEIEKIRVGDVVLTHTGNWRRVTQTGAKVAATIKLKGHHCGLVCTDMHPIYTYADGHFDWVPAKDMLHKKWGVPNKTAYLPIPTKVRQNKRQKPMPEFSEDLFYFVGRWLGDGWVRDGQRPKRSKGQRFATIFLCDSFDKRGELERTVSCISARYSIEYADTCVKVKCNGRLFCDWLTENFGRGACNKQIPAWCFSMPEEYRRALLHGILDSDGYKQEKAWRVTTVSKKLAFGIRILAETLKYRTTVYFCKRPDTYVIEDRVVNQKDTYVTEIYKKGDPQVYGDQSWYDVKDIVPESDASVVYNLSVEGDNSYTADGIVVHNCQNMSIAGNRSGLSGEKSVLFFEAVRIVKEMRKKTNGRYPRFVVWENVQGAFSSNKGEDFRCVLESLCQIKDADAHVPKPCDGKWERAGRILGEDYSIAWRLLDAQHWGVPQRRKRIYLVADFADRCAGKILFESEGLSGYSAESFSSWKRTASRFTGGIGAVCSICLNDQGGERMDISEAVTGTLRAQANHPPIILENYPTDGRLKICKDGVVQTLTSRMGTGGNNVPLVAEDSRCFDVRFTSDGTRNARQNCYETETSRTLDTNRNTPDSNHGGIAVVYGICSKKSNSMLSSNPKSGFYEAKTTRCLDANGGNPTCNQGGMAVVSVQGSMIGRALENGPNGSGVDEDVCFTLNTADRHAVAYGIDYAAFNCGKNAKFGISIEPEVEPTMMAKGVNAVAHATGEDVQYIVRRLTPVECARLQGFPDWWCDDLGTENPTETEIQEWTQVFNEYAAVMGTKPKTRNQIEKWLKDPYTDTAAYKMWGNGVALPCVWFVLSGIARAGGL